MHVDQINMNHAPEMSSDYKTSKDNLRSALIKCLKAVTPSPPTAHTMYWFWLVGSMVLSQVVSAADEAF